MAEEEEEETGSPPRTPRMGTVLECSPCRRGDEEPDECNEETGYHVGPIMHTEFEPNIFTYWCVECGADIEAAPAAEGASPLEADEAEAGGSDDSDDDLPEAGGVIVVGGSDDDEEEEANGGFGEANEDGEDAEEEETDGEEETEEVEAPSEASTGDGSDISVGIMADTGSDWVGTEDEGEIEEVEVEVEEDVEEEEAEVEVEEEEAEEEEEEVEVEVEDEIDA